MPCARRSRYNSLRCAISFVGLVTVDRLPHLDVTALPCPRCIVNLDGPCQRLQQFHHPSIAGLEPKDSSVNAFHEKAGRSQVNSCFILLDTLFLFRPLAAVAMLPSALSRRMVSLGACWAFSIQPVLPSGWRPVVSRKRGTWARRLTQSPELGFGLLSFLFLERF